MTKEALEKVMAACEGCTSCSLHETRTTLVFGTGSPSARVMLIGEAPGKNEDEGGEPFVGAAGKVLDSLLEIARLTRNQIFIANVLKCRPPENRNPRPEEIAACGAYLAGQMNAINPVVVVTMGNFATQVVLGTNEPISKIRGKRQRTKNGRIVLPTYHPAAAIYDRSKMADLETDFNTLKYLAC